MQEKTKVLITFGEEADGYENIRMEWPEGLGLKDKIFYMLVLFRYLKKTLF